jgi:hypothetical protein
MNDKRPSEHATPVDDDDDENGRNAAIIAADDTGLLTGEIHITDAELLEGGVTTTE